MSLSFTFYRLIYVASSVGLFALDCFLANGLGSLHASSMLRGLSQFVGWPSTTTLARPGPLSLYTGFASARSPRRLNSGRSVGGCTVVMSETCDMNQAEFLSMFR